MLKIVMSAVISMMFCAVGVQGVQGADLAANVACPFKISKIDIGDKAWGENMLTFTAENISDKTQKIFFHIGGRVPQGTGFGMGSEVFEIAAGQSREFTHWYFMSPGHGSFDVKVKFTVLVEGQDPYTCEPFLVEKYPVTFAIPNTKCNNLIITDHMPVFKQYFPVLPPKMGPLEPFVSESIVAYCSKGTLAYANIDSILKEREQVLLDICKVLDLPKPEQLIMFFYPEPIIKQMCTGHIGNGMASGNTIVEIYNDEVKLDPYHELTHVVMDQVGAPPAILCEGLAVYMQRGHIWNGEAVDAHCRKLLEEGKLVPLVELVKRDEIGAQDDDGQIAYPQSGSFVKFLIDSFGRGKFLEAYKALSFDGDMSEQANLNAIDKIYGSDLTELEKQWLDHLKK